MREFVENTGGRRLHNDDLEGVQDHITAIQSIFENEAPFIFSGVVFTRINNQFPVYNVSSGYVWLGGKIRYFSGISELYLGIDHFLNAKDVQSKTLHGDGVIRTSKVDYKAVVSQISVGGYNSLKLNDTENIRRYSDVNDTKYLKLSSYQNQSVKSLVSFTDPSYFNTISCAKDIDVQILNIDGGNLSANNISAPSWTHFGDMRIEGNLATSTNILCDQIETNSGGSNSVVFNSSGKVGIDHVETNSFEDGSVTEDKIDIIESRHILDGTVDEDSLATSSITTPIIKGGAVSNKQLAVDSITENKIAANEIKERNFANNSVSVNSRDFEGMEIVGMGKKWINVGSDYPDVYTVSTGLNLVGDPIRDYEYRLWISACNLRATHNDGVAKARSDYFTVRVTYVRNVALDRINLRKDMILSWMIYRKK